VLEQRREPIGDGLDVLQTMNGKAATPFDQLPLHSKH
jgi:hypothetical protein